MPDLKVGKGALVDGNLVKVIHSCFDDNTITRLNTLSLWAWSVEQISRNSQRIFDGDIMKLKKANDDINYPSICIAKLNYKTSK